MRTAPRISNPPARGVDVAIGGIAGLSSGLLGVGGGFLMVPLQVIWKRTSQHLASGTSLAAIVPIAITGAVIYDLGGSRPQLDLTVAFFVMLGGSVGAFVGSKLARRVPDRALRMLVATLLVVGAAKELHDGVLGGSATVDAGPPGFTAAQYALVTVSGALIGVLSGLTGIGGGVLLVPTLVIGFGLGQRVAQGTSLLAILPTAAVGAIVHHLDHDVDLGAAGRMGVAGIPAAIVGAGLALWLPQRLLAGLFGLLLVFMAFRMWPGREEAARA